MKTVIMLIGIPGSGKSTWFKDNYQSDNEDVVYINADSVRFSLYGDESIQGNGKQVFERVYLSFKEALQNKDINTIVVDNTNINFKTRKNYYSLIKENYTEPDYKIKLIMFNNHEIAKIRNKSRNRVVPDDVMEKMISNFQGPTEWEKYNCKIEEVF